VGVAVDDGMVIISTPRLTQGFSWRNLEKYDLSLEALLLAQSRR
jgi:hypothetical protein